jgi:lipopolysaccharide/colanic/teichoic acid biosynthesis glycosyltransferase
MLSGIKGTRLVDGPPERMLTSLHARPITIGPRLAIRRGGRWFFLLSLRISAMSEVAISIESPESSASMMPEQRFDIVVQRFSASDFETSTERTYSAQTVPEVIRPASNSTAVLPLNIQSTREDALYVVCKRAIDIFISLTAILILLPIILIAVLAVKLYDGGPVLFSQVRVGKKGREFRCFKFRSMIVNAEAMRTTLIHQNEHSDQRTFKIMNDPRVTPPGRILRRFSVDELPQLINVLRGEMSIVGPRPPLPSEVALYSAYDFQRLAVKPGLTCIWQVSGRSRLAFPNQVKLDIEYIRRRGLMTDLAIILKTFPAVLSGDGAA